MPQRAKELFEALIPLKLRWVGQGDLNLAKDPELMSLAVRSGCQALFMGLESLSQENLRATHKMPNVGTDMSAAIKTIHRAGIEIIGSFVLGLDGDDRGVFARTVEFAERHKLAAAQFSVLTPFPGTVMREQLEREGRILDNDWSHYTMSNVVFQPKHMTGCGAATRAALRLRPVLLDPLHPQAKLHPPREAPHPPARQPQLPRRRNAARASRGTPPRSSSPRDQPARCVVVAPPLGQGHTGPRGARLTRRTGSASVSPARARPLSGPSRRL